MNSFTNIDLIQILKDLDRIPAIEYLIYIDQYEESRELLGDEFFEDSHYQFRYTKSLFESGHYGRFLCESGPCLAYLLNHKNWDKGGKEQYLNILFKKAAAHIQLGEFDQAQKTTQQLQKLKYPRQNIRYLRSKIIEARTRELIYFLDNRNFYFVLLSLLLLSIAFLTYQLLYV